MALWNILKWSVYLQLYENVQEWCAWQVFLNCAQFVKTLIKSHLSSFYKENVQKVVCNCF